ncbi:MAG: serine/threonine-protein kinase [Acidobacteriota bacterium]
MKLDRWRRIEELFARAVDRPPDARRSLLDAECDGDPELRREVEDLLRAHPGADRIADRLRAAVSAMGAGSTEDGDGESAHTPEHAPRSGGTIPPAGAGDRIGAYEVEREIGRGGMGRVFLAHRADRTYRARVAIKVLPRGLVDPEHLERFFRERQILATLDHPNIARLLDAGTTNAGLPYLVMEHVEGERLDTFCDARKLPVRERLKLFLDVCSAVQRAHQSLVIHRDLKPDNVLVDATGTPKLLDFGIAKLLEGSTVPGDPRATLTSLPPMTPAYASPEQIRGGPVTTASDVYALGVMLFELLTGRRPHEESADRDDRGDRDRTEDPLPLRVLRDDPPRPSRVLTPEAAANRGATLQSLRRRLAGDLDTILLEALARDPERRYATVGALADDLSRHLDGRPVSARPATVGYRLAKLVRRNPLTTGLSSALLVALVVFAGSMTLLADRLAEERDRALREQREADQVSELLVDLFTVSDPARSLGEEVTAREVLDQGARRLRTELAGQPELRATLLDIVGRVYRNLGLYDDAAPLIEEGLALRRSTLGPEHPDSLASLTHLARVTQQGGDFDGAEALYLEALDLQTRVLGAAALPIADTLVGLAIVAQFHGRYEEADDRLSRALTILRQAAGDHSRGISDVLSRRASVRSDLQRLDAAEADSREALELDRRALGPDHPEVLSAQNSLANILRYHGELAEAEALYRKTLAAKRRVLGREHPDVAYALNGVGVCLKARGRPEEAEPFIREALEMRRKLLGDDHPAVAVSLNNEANVLRQLGRLDQAERHARESLRLARKHFSGSPYEAYPLTGLAEILLAREKPEEARPLLERALELRRRVMDPDAPLLARTESAYGACLTGLGRHREAEELLLHARDVLESDPSVPEIYREATRRRLDALHAAWRPDASTPL